MNIFTKPKPLNQVIALELTAIEPNPAQPRKQFEPVALQELADSIRENGLLQPVTVRRVESGYQLIAGERRLMACRILNMERIPAIVVEQVGEEKSAVFALIENLQRRDLNYFEQAQGIQRLMQQGALTQEQVAQKLGKSQPTVANKLRLLSFSEPMQRRMLDAGLTERHVRALLKLQSEQMVEFALAHIIQERLNVGETERYVEALLTPEPDQDQGRPKLVGRLLMIKDARIFINTINNALSTMKKAGIEIDTKKDEDEEYILYTMKIPKRGIYRTDEDKNQSTAAAAGRTAAG